MLNIYAERLKEERVINLLSTKNAATGSVFRTFLIRFPKILLAELNTHRMLVRNCGSSRAIPTKTFIKNLKSDSYTPVFTGLQAGMVGKELDSSGWKVRLVEKLWGASKWVQIGVTSLMHRLGMHKQDINRLLEPYTYVDLVLSGTEWDNFLKLRCAPDAQPAFKAIADKIKYLIETVEPVIAQPGQWHIPFADIHHEELTLQQNMQVAIARIARVSYMRHGSDEIELDKDIQLAINLLSSGHLSPLEHVAKCVPALHTVSLPSSIQPELCKYLFYDEEADYCRWTRNYAGFYTYRHHIEDNQPVK